MENRNGRKLEKQSKLPLPRKLLPGEDIDSTRKLDCTIHFREDELHFAELEELAKHIRRDVTETARGIFRMGLAAARSSIVGGLLR